MMARVTIPGGEELHGRSSMNDGSRWGGLVAKLVQLQYETNYLAPRTSDT